MGFLKGVIATIVLFVAILAAMILREPAPEGATNPYRLKFVFFVARLKLDYAPRLASTLGISSDLYVKRSAFSGRAGWNAPGVKTEDLVLLGVPVRIYRPPHDDVTTGLLPGIVYYHGGGQVIGDLESHRHVCSRLSHDTGSVVIATDFRKAPEVRYADILEDNLKVTRLILESARDFGIDPQRIAIAGDSAGGQMSLCMSLKLRDIGLRPQPKLMVAVYPLTQILDLNLPSYQQHADGPVLQRQHAGWFFSNLFMGNASKMDVFLRSGHVPSDLRNKMAATYINHDHIPMDLRYAPYEVPSHVTDDVTFDESLWDAIKDTVLDRYYSPLLAEDLSGLPEAVVYTGKYDTLRDDGILMVQRLREAGVAVHHILDPLGWHGTFAAFLLDEDSNRAFVSVVESIKKIL